MVVLEAKETGTDNVDVSFPTSSVRGTAGPRLRSRVVSPAYVTDKDTSRPLEESTPDACARLLASRTLVSTIAGHRFRSSEMLAMYSTIVLRGEGREGEYAESYIVQASRQLVDNLKWPEIEGRASARPEPGAFNHELDQRLLESLFVEPAEEEDVEFQDIVAFKNRRKEVLGTLTVDLKNLPKRRRRTSFLPDNEENQG